jgi:hypothetical protein
VNQRPPFRIEIRPLLILGGLFSEATTFHDPQWIMAIADDMAHEEQVVTLWHETVHLLMLAAGIPAPHDEKLIDAIAERLAQACPEILQVCRLVPVTEPRGAKDGD